ncbi:MAG: tetraacyldisaccharide 4'-kinase [bacterium]
MKKFIANLHYKTDYSLLEKLVLLNLKACSGFYRAITSIRLCLYKYNLIKSTKVKAYVISIGNITTGGTGKTPLTAEIANYISNTLNKKVAIISRGYAGSLSSKNTNVISDGTNILYTAEEAGEEPFWLAQNCPNSIVITGKSRITSAEKAISDYNCEVILLDDGFQHLKIKRDLNLAVIDSKNKFGNDLLLPAGPLREALNELKRADKFVITDKYQSEEKNIEFKNHLEEKYKKITYISPFKPYKLYNIKTNQELSSEITTVLAFCGIGQPDSFFNFIEEMNIQINDKIIFKDHYKYTESDIKLLEKKLNELKNLAIVTTEKDAVKIADLTENLPIYALQIKPEIDLDNLLKDLRDDRKET